MHHLFDCVLVKNMRVWNLGPSTRMDNTQRSAGLRANARIPVILKGAQVIEQVSAALQRCMGHFRSPGIDGEERRKDLMGISWLNIPPSGVKAFEERMQAPQLL